MQLTRKDFFIGSLAATAALGAQAAAPKPAGGIQGFGETSETKTDGRGSRSATRRCAWA